MRLLLRDGHELMQKARRSDLRSDESGIVGPTINGIIGITSTSEVYFESDEAMRQAIAFTRWPVIEPLCLKMVRHERSSNVIIAWDHVGDATYYTYYELQQTPEKTNERYQDTFVNRSACAA